MFVAEIVVQFCAYTFAGRIACAKQMQKSPRIENFFMIAPVNLLRRAPEWRNNPFRKLAA